MGVRGLAVSSQFFARVGVNSSVKTVDNTSWIQNGSDGYTVAKELDWRTVNFIGWLGGALITNFEILYKVLRTELS